MKKTKNIGILLAGGIGNRFGGNLPKQLSKLAGKTILEHTIDCFTKSNYIDEIAIVINRNYIHQVEEIVNRCGYNKVKKILQGGKERSDSSLAAIKAYEEESDSENINLIFHDAVRPFVSENIISSVVKALKKYNAVDVAIDATDTIIEVDSNNEITNIPNRSLLRRGQTPQAFKLKTIKKAYEKALLDGNFKVTDDCGVVLKYCSEEPIYVVEGDEYNMKITYELDMFIADKLFQIRNMELTKKSLSIEEKKGLKGKIAVVFGGSYGIGKDILDILKNSEAQVYSFSRSSNVNIKNIEDVRFALNKVYNEVGRIDYVINTAAILNKEPLINLDDDTIREIVEVNYMGMVNVARESFKFLKESKGHLLLYTSSSYTRGRAMYSLYSSTKAAVVNFTQAMSEEWKIFGIKVNCINPERTRTPMRIKNFGIEPEGSLLESVDVATVSIKTLLSNNTGAVVSVKRK